MNANVETEIETGMNECGAVAGKERPILFSGAMVRAILEGRKTQTRRVVKPQPFCWPHENWPDQPDFRASFNKDGSVFCGVCGGSQRLTRRDVTGIRNLYGMPGDRLWVRETWGTNSRWDDLPPTQCKEAKIFYAADGEWRHEHPERLDRWRPSIHMPRWASRILLEVVSVRVEPLKEITEEDAESEGAGFPLVGCDDDFCRGVFREIWESINGKGSWDLNPWVWVVEFKVVKPEQAIPTGRDAARCTPNRATDSA